MKKYRHVAHKDSDGQTSSLLWQEAKGTKEPINVPAEFGWMKRTTEYMFDMNPKWEQIWDDLEAASQIALQNLTCYDHHPINDKKVHYNRISFNIPTSPGVLLKQWKNLDPDRWWIGTVGAAGDRFDDWYATEGPDIIFPKTVLNKIFKKFPELKKGEWYYPRSARRTREIDGVWKIDPSTAYTLNPANYISTLLNAEYRTDFFTEVNRGNGYWQPKIGIEGMRQCGDPLTFTLSKWGDNLFARKDAINRASNYAVNGQIRNVTGFYPDEEQKEFCGHTVEGRHTLIINNFAIIFFKSVMDIGSLVATKMYDNLNITSMAINKYPVMGGMHCSIRGKKTPYIIKKLKEGGYEGGGHAVAGGVIIPAREEDLENLVQIIRRL